MNPNLIFQQAHAYLANAIELEALEGWLISHLGLFVQDEFPEASRLAGLIELGLAEMSMGHRTEEEFRELLEESLAVTERA